MMNGNSQGSMSRRASCCFVGVGAARGRVKGWLPRAHFQTGFDMMFRGPITELRSLSAERLAGCCRVQSRPNFLFSGLIKRNPTFDLLCPDSTAASARTCVFRTNDGDQAGFAYTCT